MMEQYIYDKFTSEIVTLRYLTSNKDIDAKQISITVSQMEQTGEHIIKNGSSEECTVLMYVIGIIKEALVLQDYDKVNSICDSTHNICELFTSFSWKRSDYWNIYIRPLKEKYAENYFADIEELFA